MIEWGSIIATAREWAATILCVLASVFAIGGTIGMFRFPDAFTRLHASSLIGTSAVFSGLLAALAIATRIIVIMLFFLVSNPAATHIIARYAWKSGIDPWTGPLRTSRRRGPKRNTPEDRPDQGSP